MKIIRVNKFSPIEEIVNNQLAEAIFTKEQYENLKKGIPQETCKYIYQLEIENKESVHGAE